MNLSSPIEIIGFVAGVFVAVSFLSQVIKSWRTKSTRDLSIMLTILNMGGQVLWITYGVGINAPALAIMSGITLLMTGSLLLLKLRFG